MNNTEKICFILIAGFAPDNIPVMGLKKALQKKGFDAIASGFFGKEDFEDFESLTATGCVENIAKIIKDAQRSHDKVIGIGISLGGAFLLEYAKTRHDLDGIISIGTPFRLKNMRLIKIARFLFPLFYPVWKRLQRIKRLRLVPIGAGIMMVEYLQNVFTVGLESVDVPVLFMHSRKDVVTDAAAVEEFVIRISSEKKQCVYFNNGNHVIDNNPELIIKHAFEFFDLPDTMEEQVTGNAFVTSEEDLALSYAEYKDSM